MSELPEFPDFIQKNGIQEFLNQLDSNWNQLEDKDKVIVIRQWLDTIKSFKNKKQILNYVAHITTWMLEKDPKKGNNLFILVTNENPGRSKNEPSSQWIESVGKHLSNFNYLLNNLEINKHNQENKTLLVKFLLNYAFSQKGKNRITTMEQLNFFEWLFIKDSFSLIPKEYYSNIIEAIKVWPLEYFPKIHEYQPYFPEEFRAKLQNELNLFIIQAEKSDKYSAEDKTDEEISFDPYQFLSQIENYIKQIEEENLDIKEEKNKEQKDYQNEIKRLNEEINQHNSQIKSLRVNLRRTEDNCELLEDDNKKIKTKNTELEKENSDLQTKIEQLNEKLDSTQKEYEQETNRLSVRLNAEHNHQLKTFKYKIAKELYSDYRQVNKIIGQNMTTELGEALRNLIQDIFQKLSKLNINFEEE